MMVYCGLSPRGTHLVLYCICLCHLLDIRVRCYRMHHLFVTILLLCCVCIICLIVFHTILCHVLDSHIQCSTVCLISIENTCDVTPCLYYLPDDHICHCIVSTSSPRWLCMMIFYVHLIDLPDYYASCYLISDFTPKEPPLMLQYVSSPPQKPCWMLRQICLSSLMAAWC